MAWYGSRTLLTLLLVLLQTCHSDATVCDHAQMTASSEQLICNGSQLARVEKGTLSSALVQRSTKLGSAADEAASIIADNSMDDSKLWTSLDTASTAKLFLPSWLMVFSCVATLAILLSATLAYCCYQAKRGPACMCTGCCAGLFILWALALIVLKVYLMRLAGPEPAGPMVQPPAKTEVVVDATVPFTKAEINSLAPVNTAYLEGMQNVLDKQSGKPGAVKVESVVASPVTAMLLQHVQSLVEHRLALVYTTVDQGITGNAPQMNASAVAADLERGLRVAAGKQSGADVPEVLKEIAEGSRPGATKTAAKLKVKFSLRCKATHQLNEDIRAAARIVISKHQEVLGKLEHIAQRTSGSLRLGNRCNDPSQKESMQLCLGPGALWVDYVTKEAVSVPKSEDTVQNFVCSLGCDLGSALSSETSKVMEAANYEKTFSQINCSPSLSNGRTCHSPCA